MPLRRGEPAPFNGQLVTTDLALELGVGLKMCNERAAADVRHERAVCRVELEGATRKADLAQTAADGRAKSCEAALKEETALANRPFWEEPSFTIPVAFIAGAVVVGAASVGVTILVLRAR